MKRFNMNCTQLLGCADAYTPKHHLDAFRPGAEEVQFCMCSLSTLCIL